VACLFLSAANCRHSTRLGSTPTRVDLWTQPSVSAGFPGGIAEDRAGSRLIRIAPTTRAQLVCGLLPASGMHASAARIVQTSRTRRLR